MTPNPANDNSRLLTPEQAASRLNITEDHLRDLVNEGTIGYINVGLGKKRPRRRFTEADLNDFIERRRGRETPCQSIKTHGRPTTHSISSTPAIGFMAARNVRLEERRRSLKL
ncbi:DNA-binding protein [Bradyrhizobium yuanmingense]|nr:DNA-binding protein [Bradyrhizobium yuanmingense]